MVRRGWYFAELDTFEQLGHAVDERVIFLEPVEMLAKLPVTAAMGS